MRTTKILFAFLALFALQATMAQETSFNPNAKIRSDQLPFPASSDGTAPIPLERSAPDYPVALLVDGFGGSATIKFTVGTDGSITDAEIVESSSESPARQRNTSNRALYKAKEAFGGVTLNAIRNWKFEPAPANARFLPATAISTWNFKVTSVGANTMAKVNALSLVAAD